MNFKFINIIILITLFTSQACKQSDPIEKKLVANWSDEFNGEELDNSKWEFQLGDGSEYGIWGWGNEEKQYYTKTKQVKCIEFQKTMCNNKIDYCKFHSRH